MTALPIVTPYTLMTHPDLLGPHFQPTATWATWRSVLKAAWSESLTPEESETFLRLAGPRSQPAVLRALWFAAGRRSGKSRIAALLAVWSACCRTYPLAVGSAAW